MVNGDLFDALTAALGSSVEGVYDTKLPDNYEVSAPVVAFSMVDDTPDTDIGGDIRMRSARWQVSIRALDLPSLRAVKDRVITALHGYAGGSIARCDFESAIGEIFEDQTIPYCYHAPVDFMILSSPA